MDLAEKNFKHSLKKSVSKEVSSPGKCHFFLFFCPITSRTGTDIDAAVNYLDEVNTASKPVIMVVLHNTFDPEKIILDSNNAIKREYISAVDCLFSDSGLLSCQKNTNAIGKIQTDLKSKKWTSYYCLKKDRPLHEPDRKKRFCCCL
uniref:Uncharacterized protein n=1 Tax=Cyprinus carpio TaxID=7962 RepID=A0A8C2IE33_CYPCA